MPHSHHIFILPFVWDAEGIHQQPFAVQRDLEQLRSVLGDQPSMQSSLSPKWQRNRFDWSRDYNEAIYFHAPLRDVLFDNGDAKPKGVLQYHIKQTGMTYEIQVASRGNDPFVLELEEITLNFFDMGIGMLAFHLNNTTYPEPKDILWINDYGRRIFPQYLQPQQPDNDTAANRLEGYGPKGNFLAQKITLRWDRGGENKHIMAEEDFEPMVRNLKEHPPEANQTAFLLPQHVKNLLPKPFGQNYSCRPLIDDRMYVVCWVGSAAWDKYVANDYSGQSADLWHSLIFVDGSTHGIANYDKMREYNRLHTYRRWAGEGLFYGICRYAFVVLGESSNGFHTGVVLRHVQTIYFQLALLSLVQRGYIVRFSEAIAALSHKVASGYRVDTHSQQVRNLYGQYLHFTNKIYFREPTPQEQGIELYKMMQQHMEIERDVNALQQEINNFSKLLDLHAGDRQSDALNMLTVAGAGLLVPALILAYYGVSAYPDTAKGTSTIFQHDIPLYAFLGMVFGLLAAWTWLVSRNWSEPVFKWVARILSIGAVLTTLYFATKVFPP